MRTNLAFAAPQLRQESSQQAFAVAREKVNSIDLSMVKLKLMDPDEGPGWKQEDVDHAETRYRRFLCMVFVYRDGSIVPTKDIDTFWHQHILDTKAYADDCERVFGEFIHHFPYFGMRGEADASELYSSFEATKSIYLGAFGEDYLAGGQVNGKCCTKCGSRCGSSKCHHPRVDAMATAA